MKKIAVIALTAVLVAVLSIGGTLAYATEATVDADVNTSGEGVDIAITPKSTQSPVRMLPGVTVSKEVGIQNTGKVAAWVWFTVTVPADEDHYLVDIAASENSDWTVVKTGKGVYEFRYDKDALAAGANTSAALSGLKLDSRVDYDRTAGKYYWVENGETTQIGLDLSEIRISIEAYAVESGSFASFADAYAAWQAESAGTANKN